MAAYGNYKLLGDTELVIMQIIWTLGPVTVRDVYETLCTERSIAYTTVMTIMGRLAEKGILKEDGSRNPGYLYTALLTKEQLLAQAVRTMVADLHSTPHERQVALAALAWGLRAH
jgi:predicted transcriptional regulator